MANLRSGSHQLSRVSERSDEYNNDLPQRSKSHNHVDLPQKSRFSLDNVKGESNRRDNRYSDDEEDYDYEDEPPQRRKNPPQASSNLFANYKIEDDPRQIARHRSYVEREEPRSLQQSFKQRRKTDPTDEEDGESYNDSSMPGNEDIMPITRPSAPTRNNRRMNGRRANRSSAFDVDSTRASLIASLKSSAVLEQKQKQEDEQKRLTSRQQQDADISASLMCRIKGSGGDISASIIHRLQEDDSGNRKKKNSQPSTIRESSKGDKKKNKSSSKESSTFRTSLIESLCDMGFNETDIEMAIEKTNAKTSSDTAKVVEWLGEHEGECETVDFHDGHSDEEKEDEEETLYTKRTQASNNTNQTTETEESDERVQELQDSLRNLGYNKVDIKRNKELYRRHSDKMDAQSFISAMLEVEDEVPMNPAEESTKKTSASSKKSKKILDESERSMDLGELEHQKLIDSISEMGFGRDQIKKVINDLSDAGARKIDADGVLAKLLNGGGDSGSSPNRSASEGNSSKFSQSCSAIGSSSKNRHTVSTSKPTDHHKETDMSIGSIEITPGQFAKLLKGRLTWNAMHNGTSVAASCIICTSTLQCCPEADYVLCPDCNVVSLIDDNDQRSRNRGSNNVGSVGLGYKKG